MNFVKPANFRWGKVKKLNLTIQLNTFNNKLKIIVNIQNMKHKIKPKEIKKEINIAINIKINTK